MLRISFCKLLLKWHFLKAHISLIWQHSVSRSFPKARLVQSSMRRAALAWHQVNPLVIAGVSFLRRDRLLQSQMGFWKACQGNFKIWNVIEKKVTTSFNSLPSLQKVSFHILCKYYISALCENQLKKCGKWIVCICLQLNIVLSAKLQPSWSDCRSLCKSLKWWNLVAIAAN